MTPAVTTHHHPVRPVGRARGLLVAAAVWAAASACSSSGPGSGGPAAGEALVATLQPAAGGPGQPGGPTVPTGPSASVAPGPSSGPLLEVMDPQVTGVAFRNTLPLERAGQFLYAGAGVAAGDYDGDGRPDIYLVSEAGRNRLFRNLGEWRFEDVTDAAGAVIDRGANTGRWDTRFPTGAGFFDADGDGDLDLFVTAFAGAATLFSNNGDGTFSDITAEAGVGYVGASTTPAFADYDRDGDVDIYVTTYRPYGLTKYYPPGTAPVREPELVYDYEDLLDGYRLVPEADVLYRNNGDGTFTDVATQAGIGGSDWGLGAVFGDLNGDGWPDLYVANDFETPDRLYINQRDGTFAEAPRSALRHTPMFSMGVDAGDVNNDGRLDLMTSDMLSRDPVQRLVQTADTMMNPNARPPEGSATQIMRNSLFINLGDMIFGDVGHYAGLVASEWTWSVKLADLDLDGYQDLLITNGFVNDSMNADEFARLKELRRQNRLRELMDEMRTRPRLRAKNLAFRNEGQLRFEDVSAAWGFDEAAISHGLALADFDGDGDLDVVVNSMNSPALLYRNRATANRLAVALRGEASNSFGLGARVTAEAASGTQYREMGIGGGYLSGHEALAVFGLGAETEVTRLVVDWPSGHRTVLDDVAANTRLTIREAAGPTKIPPPPAPSAALLSLADTSGLDYVHRESTYDDFGDQPLLPFALSRDGPGVAWGDADGDGREDLYIAAGGGSSGGLFVNNGNGRFEASAPEAAPKGLEEMAPLFWPPGTGGAVALITTLSSVEARTPAPHPAARRRDWAGGLEEVPWAPDAEVSGGAVAAADYDGDGDLDLFVAGRLRPKEYPLPADSRLYRNDGGSLVPVRSPALAGLGLVRGALWSDVDGDGDPDLLVTTEWGPVKLMKNDGGRLTDATAEAGLADITGWWTGLDAGDVDHDGDMDLVVGNLGTNTRYRATPDRPLVLFGGDVDADGDVEVVETEDRGGRLFPVRNRLEFSLGVPGVWSRFESYEEFARTPLDEILGADGLARAERFDVTTLAHTVFTNDGAGRFTGRPLPAAAQMFPAFGVAVVDLNGDGNDDVALVGNFSGAEPVHTGPLDGGVGALLAGDGAGGFAAVPPTQSGLWVPYDARGLAAGDYDGDGWTDLAVGINDGPALLFHNTGVDGRSGLLVALRGPDSNPTGVGARVEVTRADGLVMVREVRAGGSYLSQHGAALTFGLGTDRGPARVRVTWPDATVQDAEALPGEAVVVSREEGTQ